MKKWWTDLSAVLGILTCGAGIALAVAVGFGWCSVGPLIAPEIPPAAVSAGCAQVQLTADESCFQVVSNSMRPYLEEGYSVVVRRETWTTVRVGDIVALDAPCGGPRGLLHQLRSVPDSAVATIHVQGTNNLSGETCTASEITGVVMAVVY